MRDQALPGSLGLALNPNVLESLFGSCPLVKLFDVCFVCECVSYTCRKVFVGSLETHNWRDQYWSPGVREVLRCCCRLVFKLLVLITLLYITVWKENPKQDKHCSQPFVKLEDWFLCVCVCVLYIYTGSCACTPKCTCIWVEAKVWCWGPSSITDCLMFYNKVCYSNWSSLIDCLWQFTCLCLSSSEVTYTTAPSFFFLT